MRLRAGLRHALASAALVLGLCCPAIASEVAPVQHFAVSSRPITQFRIGHDEARFGPLEFVGGLEMTAAARDFGGLSAFRFLKPGSEFIGVADTGFWFFGAILRDAEGRPAGIADFSMQQMVDKMGRPIDRKWEADAEALAVKGDVATVGFERDHRVAQFRIDRSDMKGPFRLLDFLVPVRELRKNRGFETVAYAAADGPLKGSAVVVSEKSLDAEGNMFAAVLDGPRKGVFTVRRSGEFDITDGAFLPDGDLLVLERSFSILGGLRMQMRRLDRDSIGKGRLADGPVLMQADLGYQIDNMEGLDVWRRGDGATMVSLISDDNQSILQRSLYLEFILRDYERQASGSQPKS
ncbi:esterase-like activity of phytase family protein [Mesorhizobium sp. SP-1A]|uniref:esterase-like activity of phytase family protein n=1 Tax=Mesorhizobium sp. SP-1A TaxID=3077840 RepID=UPI0028F720C0|nr:esterase-like activity of phytase family protein [Mesorhizobium sp. SP-1A]